MRSRFLLIFLAAVIALAGCGGSQSTTGQTTTAPAATTHAARPATTTQATQPAAPATTTAQTTTQPQAPLISRCRATELSATFLGGQAATGHGLLGFGLRNISSHACVAFGYPGVQFLGHSGQALPTVPTHTTEDFFGPLGNHPLAVSPGTTVSFRLGVTHGAASNAGCATAYALQVIPPNDTATLRVEIPNGAYECQDTTVSPMQPGTSAYP